jgi:uncharacterized protein HemX
VGNILPRGYIRRWQKVNQKPRNTEKNGEEVNVINTTQTVNDREQVSSEKTVTANNPENTTTWTYNEHGHLLKVEPEQVHADGTVNKAVEATYTIDEVDDKNNPTLTADDRGQKRVYKYTYR